MRLAGQWQADTAYSIIPIILFKGDISLRSILSTTVASTYLPASNNIPASPMRCQCRHGGVGIYIATTVLIPADAGLLLSLLLLLLIGMMMDDEDKDDEYDDNMMMMRRRMRRNITIR